MSAYGGVLPTRVLDPMARLADHPSADPAVSVSRGDRALRRRQPDPPFPLDPLRLRRVPGYHGRQDGPAQGQADTPGAQHRPEARPSAGACGVRLRGTTRHRQARGPLYATPLLLVETTDLIFAVDSIPAILAITTSGFVVYTSNVFAIPGWRALCFALAGVVRMFRYLHYGLSVILVFVGAKMLLADVYKTSVAVSLIVVAAILAVSGIASIPWTRGPSLESARNHLETGSYPYLSSSQWYAEPARYRFSR